MARKRDIVIAVVIVFSFFITIGFFGLIFIGAFYGDDDVTFGGFGDKVAVIEVYDGIYDSGPVVRQLKRWSRASGVDAIVLHVNSPGGGVAPSQEIYSEVMRVREEEGKLVVVSMSSVAASGGYLISCAADRIVANPGTMTGSIGVIIQFPTAGKLLDKIGVDFETVKAGDLKGVGSIDRRMTSEEREMLQATVTDAYEQFVEVVAEGRGLDKADVYEMADGSVFTGRQALELGLVDTLGGFEDAIRMAAEMVGIEGEPRIVREYKPKRRFWDLLGSILGNVEDMTTSDVSGPRIMYLY
jgi:protease-4